MSALIVVLLLIAASPGPIAAGIESEVRAVRVLPRVGRTGESAVVKVPGGVVEIGFRPFAGSSRVVLRRRCPGGCAPDFRDPLLLVPIPKAVDLRVRFRLVEGELVSTTALSRLPSGTTLLFSSAGRRHSVRVR